MSDSKPPPTCTGAAVSPIVGAAADCRTEGDGRMRRGDVERRAQEIGAGRRASPSLVLRSGTSAATIRPPSRAPSVTSRQPIRSGNDRSSNASVFPSPTARYTTSSRSVFSPPAPGRVATLWSTTASAHAPPVEGEHELLRESGGIAGLAELGAELVRRNLGDVQRVPHVDVPAGDLDPRVPIDREVAERMRPRRRRRHERSCQGAAQRDQSDCDAAPHERCSHGPPRRFT